MKDQDFNGDILRFLDEKCDELTLILQGLDNSWFDTLMYLSNFKHRYSFWNQLIGLGFKLKSLSESNSILGALYFSKYSSLKDMAYFLRMGADKFEMTPWGTSVEQDIYADFSFTKTESLRVHMSNQLEILDPELDNTDFIEDLMKFIPFHQPLSVSQELSTLIETFITQVNDEFCVLMKSIHVKICLSDFLKLTKCADNILDYYIKNRVEKYSHNCFKYYYLRWDFYNFSQIAWGDKNFGNENLEWARTQTNEIRMDVLNRYQQSHNSKLQDYYLSFIDFIENYGRRKLM